MKRNIFTKAAIALLLFVSLCSIGANAEIRGDIIPDNKVTIEDVVSLIDYLLQDVREIRADVNADAKIDINDVTTLIDYLLTGEWNYGYTAPEIPDNAEVFTVNGVTFAMILVEGADNISPYSGYQNDTTYGTVSMRDFYMGQTEVTYALWSAVMGTPIEPTLMVPNEPSPMQPVESVSWEECQEFIARLNELTGREFHLPTVAQWRWAKRGGIHSQHYLYAGSSDLDEVAWVLTNRPYPCHGGMTLPVGLKKPNEIGLYDMNGNVREYTHNCTASQGDQLIDPEPWDYSIEAMGGSTDDACYSAGGISSWETMDVNKGGRYGLVGMRLALQKD